MALLSTTVGAAGLNDQMDSVVTLVKRIPSSSMAPVHRLVNVMSRLSSVAVTSSGVRAARMPVSMTVDGAASLLSASHVRQPFSCSVPLVKGLVPLLPLLLLAVLVSVL